MTIADAIHDAVDSDEVMLERARAIVDAATTKEFQTLTKIAEATDDSKTPVEALVHLMGVIALRVADQINRVARDAAWEGIKRGVAIREASKKPEET